LRLAEWPRNPYLNDEVREWVRLHLETLGAEDVAVYAMAASGQDDERRILVATEVGLLDSWYAPHGSTARFSLSVRLYPWTTVRGVDLRGETFRLWAHEHQSRWRLRLTRPALDTMADTPDLGRALAEFAASCSVMAEPAATPAPAAQPHADDPVPAFLNRASAVEAARSPRPPAASPQAPSPLPSQAASPGAIHVNGSDRGSPAPRPAAPVDRAPEASPAAQEPVAAPRQAAPPAREPEETIASLERRLGLRQPED
jgi:hypothetical protein